MGVWTVGRVVGEPQKLASYCLRCAGAMGNGKTMVSLCFVDLDACVLALRFICITGLHLME